MGPRCAGGPHAPGAAQLLLHPVARSLVDTSLGVGHEGVPALRNLVREALSHRADDISIDIELVVSELATNAALHGQFPVQARLLNLGTTMRVEVEDASAQLPMPLQPSPEAMTGRGLGVVNALATRWGADLVPGGGKVVWADFALAKAAEAPALERAANGRSRAGGDDNPERPDADPGSQRATALAKPTGPADHPSRTAAPGRGVPSARTYLVELPGIPTDMLVAAKAQVDNLARELVLLSTDKEHPLPPALTQAVRRITEEFADARDQIKRQAQAAAEGASPVTDLELRLPLDAADAGLRYLDALKVAERYCRSGRLLTTPATPSSSTLRRWYVGEIVRQLRAHMAGAPPEEPRPFSRALADEVDRLAPLEQVATGLAVLRDLAMALGHERSVEKLCELVVNAALRLDGVRSAGAHLLTKSNVLRVGAWATTPHQPVPPDLAEFSIDADLPGARAAKERRHLVLRSVEDFYAGHPGLKGWYPGERTLHMVPLVAGNDLLGLLFVAYAGGHLDDVREKALASALAGVLSQNLARERAREAAARSAELTVRLQQATSRLATCESSEEVAATVLAGARAGMGASGGGLGLVNAVRRTLRFVSSFGWDQAAVAHLTHERPLDEQSLSAMALQRRAPIFVPSAGELARYIPAERARVAAASTQRQSWVVVPMFAGAHPVGTLSLTFPETHYFSSEEQAFLGSLAGQAATALERLRRHRNDHQIAISLQQALLPERLPHLEEMASAVRYVAGSEGAQVGGDWYDLFRLEQGEVAMVIGDVAGHDLVAAGRMGHLRAQLRALARSGHTPGATLSDLDRLVHRHSDDWEELATVVYAVWSPGSPYIDVACAGHVPPMLVTRAGAHYLEVTAAPALGAALAPTVYEDARIELPASGPATIVLFTDGLVERQGEALTDGLARVVGAEAFPGPGPHDLADNIVCSMKPATGWGDDVALMICCLEGPR